MLPVVQASSISLLFGSEFIAMKTTIYQIEALHYKLQMIGVPLDSEMNVFCDNESVFKNSTLPESTLEKKHNSIAYHCTCEAQAMNMICMAWEKRETNLMDLLIKLLPHDQLHFLAQCILW